MIVAERGPPVDQRHLSEEIARLQEARLSEHARTTLEQEVHGVAAIPCLDNEVTRRVVGGPSQLCDRANVALRHPGKERQRTEDLAPIALGRPIPGSLHQHLELRRLNHLAGLLAPLAPERA